MFWGSLYQNVHREKKFISNQVIDFSDKIQVSFSLLRDERWCLCVADFCFFFPAPVGLQIHQSAPAQGARKPPHHHLLHPQLRQMDKCCHSRLVLTPQRRRRNRRMPHHSKKKKKPKKPKQQNAKDREGFSFPPLSPLLLLLLLHPECHSNSKSHHAERGG